MFLYKFFEEPRRERKIRQLLLDYERRISDNEWQLSIYERQRLNHRQWRSACVRQLSDNARRLSGYADLLIDQTTDDVSGVTYLCRLADLSKNLANVTKISVDERLLVYSTIKAVLRFRLANCTSLTNLTLPVGFKMEDVIPLLKAKGTDAQIGPNGNVTVTSGDVTWLVRKVGVGGRSTIEEVVAAP
jgi:hypothetical protein